MPASHISLRFWATSMPLKPCVSIGPGVAPQTPERTCPSILFPPMQGIGGMLGKVARAPELLIGLPLQLHPGTGPEPGRLEAAQNPSVFCRTVAIRTVPWETREEGAVQEQD